MGDKGKLDIPQSVFHRVEDPKHPGQYLYPGVFFIGTKKDATYYIRYRSPDGKQRFEKAGPTAHTAALAADVRRDRMKGREDPNSVRDAKIAAEKKLSTTFEKYSDELFPILKAHVDSLPDDPTALVFTTPSEGAMDLTNLRNWIWYPALEKAGLRRRTMYQSRHTYASLMLSAGEDPQWVSRQLGHADLSVLISHYGKYIRNRERMDVKLPPVSTGHSCC